MSKIVWTQDKWNVYKPGYRKTWCVEWVKPNGTKKFSHQNSEEAGLAKRDELIKQGFTITGTKICYLGSFDLFKI